MPITADMQHVAYVEEFSIDLAMRQVSRASDFDTGRVELTEVRVGSAVYPLRYALTGQYVRALEELLVQGVSPVFVGKGASKREAIDDFSLQVHAAFQDLLHKRPFEMNADDVNKWRTLHRIIDVTVYRNSTPVVVRQFGEVRFGARPYPSQIHWDNGLIESVHPSQVNSADFITFKPGCPIEAVVARNPLTRKLIQILYITRTRRLRTPNEIANAGLAERIGTSADLPDADWE